ncbi:5-methylcytosine-specific restriction enzyme B [compost metagenome]
MIRFYRLQMKEGSKGARVAERFLSLNRITSDLDFSGPEYDELNPSDIIMIHKGAFPISLVRIINKVPDEELTEGSFGVDYDVEILSNYSELSEIDSTAINLYGYCPPTGTFSSILRGNETFNKVCRWFNLINNQRRMQEKVDLLRYKKQIILQGPPGTGKTRLAKEIAKKITAPVQMDSPQVKVDDFFKNYIVNPEQLEFRTKSSALINDFQKLFPRESLKNLTLEQYAIGTGESDNFCWWIERGLKPLGYYTPGSARSYLIYWNKAAAEYRLHGKLLKDVTDPGEGIQLLMDQIDKLVTTKDTSEVREYLGDGLMLKILQSYYPEEFFPINSIICINNTLKVLGIQIADNDPVSKNKAILNFFNEKKEQFDKDITPYEFMGFLFSTFDLKGNIEIDSGIIVSKGEYQIIQFHPAYSYEDFVRGISVKSDGKNIHYQVEDKILVDISRNALNNPSANFVLIIDEINRANLPSVLGELIYALEYRYDEQNEAETSVLSLYNKELEEENLLKLPNNLYIIGTMNTSDRSVGHIDYAIRRRFAFVNVLPEILEIENFQKNAFKQMSELFIKNFNEYEQLKEIQLKSSDCLNAEFTPEDVWLGHSYFIASEFEFNARKKYEIVPILKEYIKDGILKDNDRTWEIINSL